MRANKQLHLFDQSVVPLRTLCNQAKLHRQRVTRRGFKFTKGLEAATDNLASVVDALLDGDVAKLKRAGIEPEMIRALGHRILHAYHEGA